MKTNTISSGKNRGLNIDDSTVLPDFACRSRLYLNPAHLLHRQAKFFEEDFQGTVHKLNDRRLGGSISGQSCIRPEEASSPEQVFVVSQIEGSEATRIHFHNRRRVLWSFALVLPQVGCVEAV